MRTLKGLVRLVLLAGAVFAALVLFASGSSSYSDPIGYYLGAAVAVIVAILLLPEALRGLIGGLIQWGILLGALGFTLMAVGSEDTLPLAAIGGLVSLFMIYPSIFLELFYHILILRRQRVAAHSVSLPAFPANCRSPTGRRRSSAPGKRAWGKSAKPLLRTHKS
ncbi:MAG TPA: hypothetical protein VFL17_09845 [Anaerolineae bacterium]|nr:hypothetical protein [Anaerolineae bacterium]